MDHRQGPEKWITEIAENTDRYKPQTWTIDVLHRHGHRPQTRAPPYTDIIKHTNIHSQTDRHTHTHTDTNTHTHTHIHTNTHTYSHPHKHRDTQTYARAHTHTHADTHTH